MLGNPIGENAESYVIEMQNAGSLLLTPKLLAKKSDLCDIACIFVELYTRPYRKEWPRETQFSNISMRFIAE